MSSDWRSINKAMSFFILYHNTYVYKYTSFTIQCYSPMYTIQLLREYIHMWTQTRRLGKPTLTLCCHQAPLEQNWLRHVSIQIWARVGGLPSGGDKSLGSGREWQYSGADITRRDLSVCAPSQWETTLHCNVVSHWLGAYAKLLLNTVNFLPNPHNKTPHISP